MKVSRRRFLKSAGQGAALLPLLPLGPACSRPSGPRPPTPDPRPPSSGFQDRYREKWTWDSVVRGTHNLNCWYQQNCCFHVYSKDGRVTREEQVGDYPQTHAGVPDFNPRGCQKGCTYSELMYSKPRLKKPLKRVGPRGSGQWKEVSWDEAVGDIARVLVDTITRDGPDTVVLDPGGSLVNQIALGSYIRLFDLLDSVLLDVNCELGDDQQGAAVTYGEPQSDRSGDDFFYSDLIFIWGGNPAYTQIPNFHFLAEARYHGVKIVAISPDLNASAMHADLWVPIKPGTDAALALSMAQVVIEEKRFSADLIREQTDLPFLVRTDTRKFLRQSDLKKGGADWVLYRFDTQAGKIEKAPMHSLEMDGSIPALEGEFEVETTEGRIKVRPVFEFLRDKLRDYTPEKASHACGVPPETIRRLARMMASSKAATNTCTSGISKFYHGDLMMRAQILIFVLCGHLGRKGAGYVSASFLLPDAIGRNFRDMQKTRELLWPMARKHGPGFVKDVLRGMSMEGATTKLIGEVFVESKMVTNSTLFWNLHGGIFDVSGRSRDWDPYLKRDVSDYLREAMDNRWFPLEPVPPKEPRVLFVGMGNTLRRVRSAHKLIEKLWPKLRLIVVTDLRMSSTALRADYVLPVSGAYEKTTAIVVNTNPISPFVHTTNRAVDNVGDSRNEWELVCLLARAVQERARARGIKTFRSRLGNTRRLDNIYDRLTKSGRLAHGDGEHLSRQIINDSTNLGDVDWEELKEKGYARFTGIGNNPANHGNACDIRPNETISPHTWHTEKKEPWLTLTGRVQFYIDHDWYLELGEELPIHKDPPFAGGRHPVTLTGGHTRWSIHSMWRSDPLMLRLQRGVPAAYVSPEDARARNLRDGDEIEIFNDIGAFTIHAKVSPTIRPGQAVIYHAWEDYQFRGGMGYRNVLASPINPVELAGNYPYFRPVLALRQPGQNDRDTRVDIKRVMSHEL